MYEMAHIVSHCTRTYIYIYIHNGCFQIALLEILQPVQLTSIRDGVTNEARASLLFDSSVLRSHVIWQVDNCNWVYNAGNN